MTRGEKIVICLLCALGLTLGIRAAAISESISTNSVTAGDEPPYTAIWLRNVFDLKPHPPPPPPDTGPAAPPPNVKLTGITTIFGDKEAYFLVQEPQQPGRPAGQEESYAMTEGQRRGALEVLEIDQKAGTVKIKNDGTISTITFETNSAPSGAAPANLAPGAGPRRPFNPGFIPNNGNIPLPTRQVRPSTSQNNPYGQPNNNNYGQQQSFGGNAGSSIPSSLFNQPQVNQQQQQVPQDTTSYEEKLAMLLAQKQLHDQAVASGAPYMAPFPPIPGSQNEGSSSSTGQAPSSTAETTPNFSVPSAPAFPPGMGPRTSGNFTLPH